MCEVTGEMSEEDLTHPVTRTSCRECGAILLINPDTGKVDAHKSPLKDSSVIEASDSQPTDRSPPVLEMRSQDKDGRDWTAVLVVVIILLVLISAGIYLVIDLNGI
jgi:hypothetical protein